MTDSGGSRRKQPKPARLDAVPSPDQAPGPHSLPKKKMIPPGTVFGPFAARQPAPTDKANILKLSYAEEGEAELSLGVEEPESRAWLRQLTLTSSQNTANALLSLKDNEVRVTVRSEVGSVGDLRAWVQPPVATVFRKTPVKTQSAPLEKKLGCDRCDTRFSSAGTLEAHQHFYCPGRVPKLPSNGVKDGGSAVLPTLDALISPTLLGLPNAILLPVASHSGPGVQVLGQPQVCSSPLATPSLILEDLLTIGLAAFRLQPLLPTARYHSLSHSSPLATPSLILEDLLTIGLAAFRLQPLLPTAGYHSLSHSSPLATPSLILEDLLTIGLAAFRLQPLLPTAGEFSLPVTLRSELGRGVGPGVGAGAGAGVGAGVGVVEESVDSGIEDGAGPLDLSGEKKASPNSNCDDGKVEETKETAKPHVCDCCGIKFSSLRTLNGHQEFYCKANEGARGEKGTARRVPAPSNPPSTAAEELPCQYCDFSASSTNQLSVHLRTVHDTIQGFVCQLCGYIGYSVRGMKSHMRSHEGENGSTPSPSPRPLSNASAKASLGKSDSGDSEKVSSSGGEWGSGGEEGGRGLLPPTILCTLCRAPFPTMDAYSAHECVARLKASPPKKPRLASEEGVGSPGSFACHFCPYRSPYKGNVKRHLSLVHKIDQREASE